jgi:hypothetical protein
MGGAGTATISALSEQDSHRATELFGTLTAEHSAVGGLLKDGMPVERALSSTLTVAEFVRRGQAAQQAVDTILSAERSKRKS